MRPFVLRAHFYLPGGRGRGKSLTSAVHHLQYIQDPKKEELVQDTTLESAAIHSRYMTERPGSAGLFGPVPDRTPSVADMEKTIETHTGPVWRLIPSVTEADARELGLMDRRRWEQVARQVMPEAAKIMGITPGNMQWVAAMHRKEGHPHLHILLWETVPTREQGRISERKLQDIHNLWMRELYRPMRQELGQEKTAIRQQARETVQAVLNGDAGIHIPPPLLKELTERLESLADHLPGHGRMALKYMPPDVKQEAHNTAQWLLQQHPDLARLITRYGDLAAEMAQHYSDDPAQQQKARVNAQADLTDRVSQIILQGAAAIDKRVRWEFVRETVNTSDPHMQQNLHRISRLRGGERKQAIHDYATQLRGDQSEKYQRPLEHRIEKSVLYIEEARRQQAAHSLRDVFSGMQAALRQAEFENHRAAFRHSSHETWIDEARAHVASESRIAEIEMG